MRARHIFLGVLLMTACAEPALAQYPGAQYGPPPVFMPPGIYPSPYGMLPPAQTGQRCASAAGVCFMGVRGPIGAPCFCQTPYGAAPGQVLP